MSSHTIFASNPHANSIKMPIDYKAAPLWKIENEGALKCFFITNAVSALFCLACIFVEIEPVSKIFSFYFLSIINIFFLLKIDQKKNKF